MATISDFQMDTAPFDQLVHAVARQHDAALESACSKLSLVNAELSEREKLAVCMNGGCDIDYVMEGEKLVMKTRHPCGVVIVDGKFMIGERKQ